MLIVTVAGCGGASDDGEVIAGVAVERLAEPVRGLVAWQLQALDDPPAAPAADDIRTFYHLRQDLTIPDRRAAAQDTLQALLAATPDHFLWIEAALVRMHYLQDVSWLVEHLIATVEADSGGPVAEFIIARRDWDRVEDADLGFVRAAADSHQLDALQERWLTMRVALVESRRADNQAALARLADGLKPAWETGGLPFAACWWFEISKVTRRLGWLDESLVAAHLMSECAHRDGNEIQRIRGQLSRSRTHMARAEYSEALQAAQTTMELAVAGDHLRWRKDASRQIASILDTWGDRRGALSVYRDLYDFCHGVADTQAVIAAQLGVAISFLSLGQTDSATVWLDAATALDRAGTGHGYADRIAVIRWREAMQVGRYSAAESLLVAMPRFASFRGRRQVLFDFMELGFELARPDIVYRCLALAERDSTLLIPDDYYDPVLDLAQFAARFHAYQGEFDLTYRYLETAAASYAAGCTPYAQWDYLDCVACVAELEGDLSRAIDHHRQAIAVATDMNDFRRVDRSRIRLGECLIAAGRTDEARELFDPCRRSPEYWSRLAAHILLGCAEAKDGRHRSALRSYDEAAALLGRDAPADLQARLHLVRARSLARLGRHRESLAQLDRIRLVPGFGASGSGDEAYAAFFRPVREDVAELQIALLVDDAAGHDEAGTALQTLAVAEDLRRRPDDAGPPPTAADLAQVAIGPGAPVAVYFLGRERAYLWVGTDAGWMVDDLGDRDTLADLVRDVQIDMRSPGRDIDREAARRLSRRLLAPVLPHWRADEPLHVVASGILEDLPWPALPLEADGGEPALVVDHGPVVHLDRVAAPARRREAPGPLLALGVDAAGGAPLRHAETEAAAVAAAWPGPTRTLLRGDAADWTQATAGAVGGYHTIHVASHATVSEGASGVAVMRFAGREDQLPVTVHEIGALDLDAELVFLSCCEGGRVLHDRGSGLDSLARSFLQAGARTVVASTCLVDDAAARDFALAFYRRWPDDRRQAEAIRSTQQEFARPGSPWAHPFYWAFYRLHAAGMVDR